MGVSFEEKRVPLTVGDPGWNEVLVEDAGGGVASADGAGDERQLALVLLHDGARLRLHEVRLLAVAERVLRRQTRRNALAIRRLYLIICLITS